MSSLNLFPARVPIGSVTLPDGTELDAMASMEFLKALKDLFERVGGANGMDFGDLTALLFQALTPSPGTGQETAYVEPVVDVGPAVADLAGQIAEVRLLECMGVYEEKLARLSAQIDEMAMQLSQSAAPPPNYGDYLQAYAEPLAQIDWEHPGKIGASTPNSGAFTSLSATAQVALSPANANVVISPTGTGLVTINPATTGAIDNIVIGATTPKAIKGTTLDGTVLTTTGAFSLFGGLLRSSGTTGLQFDGASTTTNAEAFFENTDAALTVHASSSGAVTKTIDFCATGAATVHFQVLNTGTITTGTHKVGGAFGCNTKAPQTAVASGAALAAYAAGANGLSTGAAMQALVDKVTVMDLALKANGILS